MPSWSGAAVVYSLQLLHMGLLTTKFKPRTTPSWRGIAQWTLTVTGAGQKPRVFHLLAGTPLRVGTNAANDIVLSDATASRMHAELSAEEAGVRVRDLGSTNGTWWQGSRLVEAIVSSGVIQLGESSIAVASAANAQQPLAETNHFGPLVGQSAAMRALFKTLSHLASSNSTVLIQAESGSGKELVARALHQAGPRADKPYVVFDCAAVAPTLIESALFGHEKGAFTGASSRKIGCFEEAHGGTLFLDEVGELPLELQPRLLRALESREIRRVGGDKAIPIDVRLMAATHRDLARDVNRGQFREDLYYRLAVVRLRIPPLRERLEDLRLLVEHLMLQATGGDEARVTELLNGIDEDHWQQLRSHPWRGNVRELRNAVERSLALSHQLTPNSDLRPTAHKTPPALGDTAGPGADEAFTLDQPFLEQKQQLLERFESRYLQAMVERHEGNLSRAAANAGIDRMYFKRLLKKYGLP